MRVMCINAAIKAAVTETGSRCDNRPAFQLQEGRDYTVYSTVTAPYDETRIFYQLFEAPINECFDAKLFIPLTD